VRVEDHSGTQWIVAPGDPAAKLVNVLKRFNYEYIVLPFRVLTDGASCGIMHRTPLSLPSGASPAESQPPVAQVVRSVRHNDCLALLEREAVFAEAMGEL
jgi:hypothetical protein